MASTIKGGTLTVKIQEKIKLGGVELGGGTTCIIASVAQFHRRIMTIDASNEIALGLFDITAIAAGVYDKDDIRYVRVTNLDDTNYVNLRLVTPTEDAGGCYKLQAGQTMIFTTTEFDGATTIAGISWDEFRFIFAKADSASVDIELVVASA